MVRSEASTPATAHETTAGRPVLLGDLSRDRLASWCAEQAVPAWRADQIRQWIYRGRVGSFDDMTNLPRSLRRMLNETFALFASEIIRRQVSRDGTEKLLLTLRDGETTECVLMREPGRITVCISTQVGCAMGCVFCASGMLGVKRNLTAGEILDQVLRLDRLLAADERITNVVVMGMGEPLANLDALLPALDTLRDERAFGLGARRITVSTVGLPEKMRRLADCGAPYNLAVSLHAPNDQLRTRIVPVNSNVGIAAILSAADRYFDRTGRRVTYEYVLLAEINDEPRHAAELATLLRDRHAHVNVIPMNAVDALSVTGSSRERTDRFVRRLRDGGINVTVRKRKGADIDAACGQLRLDEATAVEPS